MAEGDSTSRALGAAPRRSSTLDDAPEWASPKRQSEKLRTGSAAGRRSAARRRGERVEVVHHAREAEIAERVEAREERLGLVVEVGLDREVELKPPVRARRRAQGGARSGPPSTPRR